MLKIKTISKQVTLKRRDFISRSIAFGGITLLYGATGPAYALGTSTHEFSLPSVSRKTVKTVNTTIRDFKGLIGQNFRLRTKNGMAIQAKLIEASCSQKKRGLRFRREPFSIVFDIPKGIELVQTHYHLSHPQIGLLELFMVPVDLPIQHNRLEAIFS